MKIEETFVDPLSVIYNAYEVVLCGVCDGQTEDYDKHYDEGFLCNHCSLVWWRKWNGGLSELEVDVVKSLEYQQKRLAEEKRNQEELKQKLTT